MKNAIWFLIAIVCAASCSSGGTSTSTTGGAKCAPGIQVSCPCVNGAEGFQVCASDGESFGECQGCDMCRTGDKKCGSQCVPADSTAFGCESSSCEPCSYTNATAICDNGACAFGHCGQGFADCDGDLSNGCETNITTDMENCGGCDTKCTIPHATAACIGGKCTPMTCDPGWGMCKSVACDVDITKDPKNCGGCGKACPAGDGCAGSTCYTCGYAGPTAGAGTTNLVNYFHVPAWKYVPSHDEAVNTVSASTTNIGTVQWRTVIFPDDGAGNPMAAPIIGQSDYTSSDLSVFSQPVTLHAGTTYWIGMQGSSMGGVTVNTIYSPGSPMWVFLSGSVWQKQGTDQVPSSLVIGGSCL